MKEIGQNVKVKIDEFNQMRIDNKKSIENFTEEDLPEAYCAGCGTSLNSDLRHFLFQGKTIVCEYCGEIMKIDINNNASNE